MNELTQENKRAPGYRERQEKVLVQGKKIWCDKDLVRLIVALNYVGLETRSHCSGHGSGNAFIVIKLDTITEFQIRKHGSYNEVIIHWDLRQNKHGRAQKSERRLKSWPIYDCPTCPGFKKRGSRLAVCECCNKHLDFVNTHKSIIPEWCPLSTHRKDNEI